MMSTAGRQADSQAGSPRADITTRPARRTTAERIVQVLRLPNTGPDPAPPQPLPLSRLPHLPRETSMLYTIGRLDRSGRITNGPITDALRWQPGDRIGIALAPGAAIYRPAADGQLRTPPRPCIIVPASARHFLGIAPSDNVLLAAAPEYRIVIVHSMRAVDDMLVSFYTEIAAAAGTGHE
jgi:hypothetical protein